MQKNGFTLIELLVVISIISLLSSIVLSSVQAARTKALQTKAKTDVYQIVKAIIYAQGESGRQMFIFAPFSNWTGGFCTANGHLPSEAGCYSRVDQALTQIESAGGNTYQGLPRTDPWGVPYQMDANYGENIGGNYCIRDNIFLVKPDGTIRTIPGIANIIPRYPMATDPGGTPCPYDP